MINKNLRENKMKKIIIIFCFLVFTVIQINAQQSEFPKLTGQYLGQKPPGMTPEIFAPGIISFGFHELRITFSPEADEAFYVTSDNSYMHRVLVHIKSNNDTWLAPQLAPFAWEHNNGSPSFSPDGKRVYLASNRDYPDIIMDGSGLDIWYIERDGTGWSDPIKLPDEINSELGGEHSPSVTANGNLYFSFTDENNKTYIYCSKFADGKYYPRERIEIDIQPDVNLGSSFVAPDESYLLFQADIPGGYGGNDIYVSFRNENTDWGAPINLGEEINSKYSDIGPRVTFDGKYLFFTSYRRYSSDVFKGKSYDEFINMLKSPQNGYGTLYWVDAKIIEELRP